LRLNEDVPIQAMRSTNETTRLGAEIWPFGHANYLGLTVLL
jgi:hypothetical protein